MKTVYIHIGTDKTGSTAIQRTLSQVKGSLSELGVNYLDSTRFNHRYIDTAAKAGRWEVLEDVRKEILSSPCDEHVISFEGLYRLEGESLGYFLSFFEDFFVKVILYLRSRPDKMRSGLGQRMKSGEGYNKNLFEKIYAEGNLSKAFSKEGFDYARIVERWEAALGNLKEGCLDLGIYEKGGLEEGDVVVDFMTRIGLESSVVSNLLDLSKKRDDDSVSANPSFSPAAQDLLALTAVLASDKRKYRIVSEIVERHDPVEEKKHSRLSDDVVGEFCAGFLEGDKEVARKYFGRDELFQGSSGFKYKAPSPETFYKLSRSVLSEVNRIGDLVGEEDKYIPALRRAAVALEKDDIFLAKQLMLLASLIRPNGPAIRNKLSEYNQRIQNDFE